MRAAVLNKFGSVDSVRIEEVDTPEPSEQEIQIQVHSAGVNPADWKICEGYFKDRMKHEFPITLGWDVSGVVSKVGKSVKNVKEGDPVLAYCRKNDVIHSGSFAEFICLDYRNIAHKPQNLTHTQAASIPLVSLTAWQSLFDSAHLKANEQVLIHAGAGGVGSFAIQFAKIKGAKVFTTASQKHHDYVKKLGADTVIDYTKEDFVQKVKSLTPQGVDVVYDCVGGKTLTSSYDIAKTGGRLVTIAGVVDNTLAEKRHIEANFVFVRPDGKELGEITKLIEAGKVFIPEIEEMGFDQVVPALKKVQEGHTQGKIVLRIR